MPRSIAFRLVISLACVVMIAIATAAPLEYSVVYRGVFSMGRDMPIADVTLQAREPDSRSTHGLREFALEASSAAYPVVESLYPLRYRFRTWAAHDGNVIGFETYEKTRKRRHRLYLRDIVDNGFLRHDADELDAAGAIERLQAGELPQQIPDGALDGPPLSDLLLDRLGLLQYVRDSALREGAEFVLPVSNGRDRFRYRVRVETSPSLMLRGVRVPAWKLRFDGFEIDTDDHERPAHRALFVWLSRDPARVPLRVDARHVIGLFRVELKNPVAYPQLVKLDSAQSSTR